MGAILFVAACFFVLICGEQANAMGVRSFPDLPADVVSVDISDKVNVSGSAMLHHVSGVHLVDVTGPDRYGGQVWSKQPVNLNDPFDLEFYAYLGNAFENGVVADGLTVTLRNGPPLYSGRFGSGMGVYGPSLGEAFVLEFDTYYNNVLNQNRDVRDGDSDLRDLTTKSGNYVGHIAFRTSDRFGFLSLHRMLAQGLQMSPIAYGGWQKIVYRWDPAANYGYGSVSVTIGSMTFRYRYNIRYDVQDPEHVYWGITGSTSDSAANWGQDQGVVFSKLVFGTQLNIQKVNPAGEPLAGAVFNIVKANNTTAVYEQLVTNDNGMASALLPSGDYILSEVTAPDGHDLPSKKSWNLRVYPGNAIDIDGRPRLKENQTVTLAVENQFRPVSLDIEKKVADSSNQSIPLSGAVFQLAMQRADGQFEVIGSSTTDQTGHVAFTLPKPGDFQLLETQVPAGFVPAPAPKHFSLDKYGRIIYTGHEYSETGGVRQFRLENRLKEFDLTVTNTDIEGNLLKGAVFELTGPEMSVKLPADNQQLDRFIFNHLPPGEYTLSQISPPDGFIGLEKPITFRIHPDGTVDSESKVASELMTGDEPNRLAIDVMNEEKTVPFSFYKVTRTGRPLAGAQFTLYDCQSSGKEYQHDTPEPSKTENCWQEKAVAVSSSDGFLSFGELTKGEYLLKETRAPSGYHLPEGRWLLSIHPEKPTLQEQMTITGQGSQLPPAFFYGDKEGTVVLQLPNDIKQTLPATGSYGAALVIICGIVSVGSGLLLVRGVLVKGKHDAK